MMSSVEQNSLKKENKKAFKKFIIIMVACTLVGVLFGLFVAAYKVGNVSFLKEMRSLETSMLVTKGLAIAAPFAIWGSIIGCAGLGVYWLNYAKKKYAKWDGEDDAYIDNLEGKLNFIITLSSCSLYVVYLFFTAGVFANLQAIYTKPISFFATLIGMFASMTVVMKLQKEIVDFVRTMNPEKKGSIYDMDFHNKWIKSSDELEKLIVYKASYGAYKAVNNLCMVLFVVYFFIGCLFDSGMLPMITVLGIMIFNTIVYTREIKKCEKLR